MSINFDHVLDGLICEKFILFSNFFPSENKVFCDFQNMIQYIGERLMTAKRVAVAKWDTNDTIVDPIREEQILKNITKEAEDIGLDPIWAKIFFRNQIDANIYVQQNLHLKWDRTGFRPHGPAVDLVTEIRPIIDKLNKELINVSFETRFIRSTNWCHFLREISAENTRKVLIMNSIERRAFEIALRNVCLHFIR